MIRFRLGAFITAAVTATAVTAGVALLPIDVTPLTASHRAVEAAAVTPAAGTPKRAYELYRKSAPSKPYRWLACRAIDYRIDVRHAPAGVPAVIRAVMRRIGGQTGVTFHDAGNDHRSFDSTSFDATTPTIYFSFGGSDGTNPFAADGEVGIGGPSAGWSSDGGGHVFEAILFGRVQLWSGWHAKRTGAGVTWQSLITHEVGHALNLAHRTSRTAVMNPTLSAANPGRFTPAEVQALTQTLQRTGCDYAAYRALARSS